ncbi:MAG: cyanase [Acidihalobacter sp.]
MHMTREEVTAAVLEAKRAKGLTWAATAAVGLLGLDAACVAVLTECPLKGSLKSEIPADPLIYRLHEITQVYGSTIKALIHEEFGDGIMSAIDFELDIERVPDPKGDRVKITYNGKFLPYRKW